MDDRGEVVDGDQIMAILATTMQRRGKLTDDTLVATVMSNLGLKIAMREHGIRIVETKVGDRYVLAELNRLGLALGGEQSGHVILTQHATTGDGVLTGLYLASVVALTGKPLSELKQVMKVYPQVLVNVRDVRKEECDTDAELQAAVARLNADFGESGRVLLRPSGTEPVVRVMVEAATHEIAHRAAHELADLVRARLAL